MENKEILQLLINNLKEARIQIIKTSKDSNLDFQAWRDCEQKSILNNLDKFILDIQKMDWEMYIKYLTNIK